MNKQVAGYTNKLLTIMSRSFLSLVSVSKMKSGFCVSSDKKFIELSVF